MTCISAFLMPWFDKRKIYEMKQRTDYILLDPFLYIKKCLIIRLLQFKQHFSGPSWRICFSYDDIHWISSLHAIRLESAELVFAIFNNSFYQSPRFSHFFSNFSSVKLTALILKFQAKRPEDVEKRRQSSAADGRMSRLQK